MGVAEFFPTNSRLHCSDRKPALNNTDALCCSLCSLLNTTDWVARRSKNKAIANLLSGKDLLNIFHRSS